MKKIFIISLFLLGIVGVKAAQETRVISPFTKISASTGVPILLVESSSEKVVIDVDNASTSLVNTELSNGTLRVSISPTIGKNIKLLVTIYYKSLDDLDVLTGASIESNNPIFAENLKLRATLGGKIKVKTETTNLTIIANQGSPVEVEGVCSNLKAKATTGGVIKALNLMATSAEVRTSTGGLASVRVKNTLDANVTASIIEYAGTPNVVSKKSLGGNVRPVENDPGYTYSK